MFVTWLGVHWFPLSMHPFILSWVTHQTGSCSRPGWDVSFCMLSYGGQYFIWHSNSNRIFHLIRCSEFFLYLLLYFLCSETKATQFSWGSQPSLWHTWSGLLISKK